MPVSRTKQKRPANFAILPYLKTSEPVYIFDLVFRSIKDTNHLSPSDKGRLSEISSLFFLAHHLRITDMVYVTLPDTGDEEIRRKQQKQLSVAQILIGYLYTSPSTNGEPFYSFEHSSIYFFDPTMVSEYALESSERTENLWPPDSRPIYNRRYDTPGYTVHLNFTSSFFVASGSRIYPPAHRIWLNSSQDLRTELLMYSVNARNWAIIEFFKNIEDNDSEFSTRVINALEWYNRSASINAAEEIALLSVAIGLETLLGLEQGDGFTKRFKEAVQILIGPTPQLGEWIEQFYKARSKIVHHGKWHTLMYQTRESLSNKSEKKKIKKDMEQGTGHGALVTHGRRVFRLCVNAILSGAMTAEQTRLGSWFINNQERLINICKILNQTEKTAPQRLVDIRQEVLDLHEFWAGSEKIIELETLVAAGKLIAKTYVETNPRIPNNIRSSIEQIINTSNKVDIAQRLDNFKSLAEDIQKWKKDNSFLRTMQGRELRLFKMKEDSISILRVFLEYAAMPHIELKALTEALSPPQ